MLPLVEYKAGVARRAGIIILDSLSPFPSFFNVDGVYARCVSTFLLFGRAILSNIEDRVEGGMSWRRGTIGIVDVYITTPGIFSTNRLQTQLSMAFFVRTGVHTNVAATRTTKKKHNYKSSDKCNFLQERQFFLQTH